MKDLLLLNVRKFLQPRLFPGRSLLLGYSGGPDSKALLYLLLECRRSFSFELHLAHVDHGWREESKMEAQDIQTEARVLGLPLFLKTLSMDDFNPGNLEEQGRIYRYEFFSQIYAQSNCQALVLGHHADDQAEIILKRTFEGASVFSLGGLAHSSLFQEMQIWRPLLSVRKSQVLEWLSEKNLDYFQDPTNSNPRFLRGKMREEMLPFLCTSFGKEIVENLCRLGDESKEIKDYFSNLNQSILAKIQKTSKGDQLDLNPFLPMAALQLKYLLKEWLTREKKTFSRQIVEGIVLALRDRASKKRFISKECEFQIERGYLYFSKNK
jgi:tRNA(Ile)-lysidine synthase